MRRSQMSSLFHHCWVCDFKRAWSNLQHKKVARWTVGVHVVYYVHAATDAHGIHMLTAIACAAVLLLELFAKD